MVLTAPGVVSWLPTTLFTDAADPMPGLGVLMAIVAILIAVAIARSKRRYYENSRNEL